MGLTKIPKKKKGEFRLIYVPNKEEKELLERLLPYLHELCHKLCDHNVVHGFSLGKSPVTCAMRHIGYQFTLSHDLKNFFDEITVNHVKDIITELLDNIIPPPKITIDNIGRQVEYTRVSESVLSKLFIDGHCYQGLPTSPLVANLAAIKLDSDISNGLKNIDDKIVYTRYADDLTISFNDYKSLQSIKDIISKAVIDSNFTLNNGKTRLQTSKYGYRNVTGISVGPDKIYLPRRFKRRMRALNHMVESQKTNPNKQTKRDKYLAYKWKRQLDGLREYSKLKYPHHSPFHIVDVLKRLKEVIRVTNTVGKQRINTAKLSKNGVDYVDAETSIRDKANDLSDRLKSRYNYEDHGIKHYIRDFVTNWFTSDAKKTYLKTISDIIIEEKEKKS